MTEAMVPVSGGEVWTDDSGGDGPVLFALHPGVGDSRIWEPVLPALTGRFRVIRYDARGYGRSPLPSREYSLRADFDAVRAHFGVERFGLVGCSMGGGVAAGVAVDEPDRVTGLVLLCPGVPGYPWPPEPDLDAEFDAVGEDLDGLVRLGLREWAAAGHDPAATAQLRSAAAAWPAEDRYQRADPPVFHRLDELAVPTVLMIGDRDRPAVVAASLSAAAHIPDCELIELPGVDHLPPLREPDRVARTIIDHFGRS